MCFFMTSLASQPIGYCGRCIDCALGISLATIGGWFIAIPGRLPSAQTTWKSLTSEESILSSSLFALGVNIHYSWSWDTITDRILVELTVKAAESSESKMICTINLVYRPLSINETGQSGRYKNMWVTKYPPNWQPLAWKKNWVQVFPVAPIIVDFWPDRGARGWVTTECSPPAYIP